MTFEDILDNDAMTPYGLTVATSGLSNNDELLAFSICNLKTKEKQLTVKKVTDELLLPAEQYHQLSRDIVQTKGISAKDFKKELLNVFEKDDIVLFTYNIPFHVSFISRELEDAGKSIRLYDLSVIERAIRNKYAFSVEELSSFTEMYMACCSSTQPLSISSICRNLHISRNPYPGQLPLIHMQEILSLLYLSSSSTAIVQLPS